MNQFELDKQLKSLKQDESPMSDYVRERLESTYSSISGGKIDNAKRPGHSRKRIIVGGGAAAAVLAISLFTSAFASPVMADSIRQIPLIGSLFSSIDRDLGLQNAGNEGLTSQVNSSVSYMDVKMDVTETVLDGSRAVYALTVTAPNLQDGKYDTGNEIVTLSKAIEVLTFKVKGGEVDDFGDQYFAAGKDRPNTIIVEHIMNPLTGETTLAETNEFDAEVEVKLTGIDHTFTVTVPFIKKTGETVSLKPSEVKTAEDLIFTAAAIDVTPMTTRLEFSLAKVSEKPLSEKEEHELMYTNVAVYDDQGNLLQSLNGKGVIQGNTFTKTVHYASARKETKYLILKPFDMEEAIFSKKIRNSQFIDGLEIRIDLPHADQ